jgi:hypothetical protein
LDLEPTDLHQRTPLIMGSKLDVAEAEQFIQGRHQAVVEERRTVQDVSAES